MRTTRHRQIGSIGSRRRWAGIVLLATLGATTTIAACTVKNDLYCDDDDDPCDPGERCNLETNTCFEVDGGISTLESGARDADGAIAPRTDGPTMPDDSGPQLECSVGEQRDCYTGPAGTENVGACKPGKQTCSAGSWSGCVGAVAPKPETCDDVDNDCDGATDEELTDSCYTGPGGTEGVGECKAGLKTCDTGKWSGCEGEVVPKQSEVCGDGKDDDCDGAADQGCQCAPGAKQPCGSDVGECQKGTQTCSGAAKWGACEGEVTATDETCDNKDNDCDGNTDEALTRSCYDGAAGTEGKGLCKAGSQSCSAGKWSSCSGQVLPTGESCDNQDNDCDGTADGYAEACYTGPTATKDVGNCKSGTKQCTAGGWSACSGEIHPIAETCNNQDDDCDGVKDGLTRGCYTGLASTRNVGVCTDGTETCTAGVWGGDCSGEVLPTTETCNNADDDCDGSTDGMTDDCYTGPAGTEGVGQCKGGTKTCSGGVWGSCVGEVLPASSETCNGIDDNCVGGIDEGVKNTLYKDGDGDGYGDPSQTIQTCSATVSGYVSNDDDCHDGNGTVKPGQTYQDQPYTATNGTTSWDYDCSGTESLETGGGWCGPLECAPPAPCLSYVSTVLDPVLCPSVDDDDGLIRGGGAWRDSVPACGGTGQWMTACSATHTGCSATTASKLQRCK